MLKRRLTGAFLVATTAIIGYFVYATEVVPSRFSFKLGLDLKGGTHLLYEADTNALPRKDVSGAMAALRDVIERRVNLFGVSEPLIQVETEGESDRLIVELPGVTDVDQAVTLIGQTPLLDFRIMRELGDVTEEELIKKTVDEVFEATTLTGRYLKRAELVFDQTTGSPKVVIHFNDEGSALFEKITRENTGRILAIFLDGIPISTPVIREAIAGGSAEISGAFDAKEARRLTRDLNYGALPVPITLLSTQTIGASLGEAAVEAGVRVAVIAFVAIALFLILWYRLPGVIAVVALAIYLVLNLAIFKLIPVTLTAAGIAGFILSMGMAVDANILIFERFKEELRRGRTFHDAMVEGFARAWNSIRDSNVSSIITAVILFYFASTPIIKGFALVFGIGVIVSMFSAITASRTLLLAIRLHDTKVGRFLFSCGIRP